MMNMQNPNNHIRAIREIAQAPLRPPHLPAGEFKRSERFESLTSFVPCGILILENCRQDVVAVWLFPDEGLPQ
jgi:hypothetical protein